MFALRFEWLAWAALWLAARSVLLLAFCDVFVYGEEFEKACAGKALLDGVDVPLHLLPYHAYEGGGFVVSCLDALSFATVGESVLAIKLVALGLGAAILALGWSVCERFAGRGAARAFALLYVFAPESVQANSLLALGIHYQANLFIAAILILALRVALLRDVRPRTWLALGASIGFGVYFSLQCALTAVVALGLVLVSLRKSVLRPATAWFAPGVLLGAAPLLWMASKVGTDVFDIHGAALLGGGQGKLDLVRQFGASLFAGRPWWDSAAVVLVALVPLAALSALRACESRALRWVMLTLVAHAALFGAAYLVSGFTRGAVLHYFYLQRLMPLWFLGVLLVGLAAGRRRWMWIPVATLACLGALDTYRLTRDAAPREWGAHLATLATTKGYRYSQYLQKIAPRLAGTRPEQLARLLAFRERDPAPLHEALAIALYGSGAGSFEAMCAEMNAAGVRDLAAFYRGLGLMLMRHHGPDVAVRIAVVAPFPQPISEPLIESIARFPDLQTWEFSRVDAVLAEARAALAAGYPEPYFVGLGRSFHDALGDARVRHYFERRVGPVFLDPEQARAQLAQLPDAAREPMLRGYAAARRERSLE